MNSPNLMSPIWKAMCPIWKEVCPKAMKAKPVAAGTSQQQGRVGRQCSCRLYLYWNTPISNISTHYLSLYGEQQPPCTILIILALLVLLSPHYLHSHYCSLSGTSIVLSYCSTYRLSIVLNSI